MIPRGPFQPLPFCVTAVSHIPLSDSGAVLVDAGKVQSLRSLAGRYRLPTVPVRAPTVVCLLTRSGRTEAKNTLVIREMLRMACAQQYVHTGPHRHACIHFDPCSWLKTKDLLMPHHFTPVHSLTQFVWIPSPSLKNTQPPSVSCGGSVDFFFFFSSSPLAFVAQWRLWKDRDNVFNVFFSKTLSPLPQFFCWQRPSATQCKKERTRYTYSLKHLVNNLVWLMQHGMLTCIAAEVPPPPWSGTPLQGPGHGERDVGGLRLK